ncbi:MAG: MazG-like family protein [Acinetobacter sp.]
MNLQELIKAIEQWAEDRNIIKGSKPIDQAMKLFSEFGELADNVGKGRDCRDDIGDCIVVLTIIAKQLDLDMLGFCNFDHEVINYPIKETVACLGHSLGMLLSDMSDNYEVDFIVSIGLLHSIATKYESSLEECVQIAYNDIKDRKGLMHNGVFVKESDPVYASIVASIESNC